VDSILPIKSVAPEQIGAGTAMADMRRLLPFSLHGGGEKTLAEDYDACLQYTAYRHAIPFEDLKLLLEKRASNALRDSNLPIKERICALREAGKFVQARDLAGQWTDQGESGKLSEVIELLIDNAKADIELMRWDSALNQCQRAEKFARRNRDAVLLSKARHERCRAVWLQGDVQAAFPICEELISFCKSNLGPEHVETLASRDLWATMLTSVGLTEDSEPELRAVLASRCRLLGAEHPETLRTRSHLVRALEKDGRSEESRNEQRSLLAAMEHAAGTEHPATLKIRNELARKIVFGLTDN
jgi:hypothetical protein